jgi:hypothetical protein
MTEFDHQDICEALRNILRGEHTFTDATRITAIEQVQHLAEARIYRGRRPQGVGLGPFISITKPSVLREYALHGEVDEVESAVEIICYSLDADLTDRLQDAIRQSLTSLKADITVGTSTITIGGCTLDEEGDFEPDDPRDASDEYIFMYRQSWRINHSQVVPAGVN